MSLPVFWEGLSPAVGLCKKEPWCHGCCRLEPRNKQSAGCIKQSCPSLSGCRQYWTCAPHIVEPIAIAAVNLDKASFHNIPHSEHLVRNGVHRHQAQAFLKTSVCAE